MYLQKKNLTKPSDTAEEISNVPSQKFWLDLLKGTIDALSTWLINIDKINNLELDYSNKNSPVDLNITQKRKLNTLIVFLAVSQNIFRQMLSKIK